MLREQGFDATTFGLCRPTSYQTASIRDKLNYWLAYFLGNVFWNICMTKSDIGLPGALFCILKSETYEHLLNGWREARNSNLRPSGYEPGRSYPDWLHPRQINYWIYISFICSKIKINYVAKKTSFWLREQSNLRTFGFMSRRATRCSISAAILNDW